MSGPEEVSVNPTNSPAAGTVEIEPLLWKNFLEASDQATLTESWLALLCRQISAVAEVSQGLLLLQREDGQYAPAATFPQASQADVERLAFVAEKALLDQRAIAHRSPQYLEEIQIAWPVMVENNSVAAVVVAVDHDADSAAVLRQLQWAGGWISALWQDRSAKSDAMLVGAAELVSENLGFSGSTQDTARFLAQLGVLVGAERVSFARGGKRSVQLVNMSGTTKFEASASFSGSLIAAMNECWSQRQLIFSGEMFDDTVAISDAHNRLREDMGSAAVVSTVFEDQAAHTGVLTFEYASDIEESRLAQLEIVSDLAGPMLLQNLQNDRSPLAYFAASVAGLRDRLLRPRSPGEKVALGGALLLPLVIMLWPVDYDITASAKVEGLVQRHIVAVQDGIIASARVRAGEFVSEGEEIARLDNRELLLERLSAETRRRQLIAEEARALAQRDLATSRIVRAQLEGAESELELLDTLLLLMEFTAPFDGLVIEGDLSQRIGASVERGETLFVVAPLDGFRVLLKVDEEDIAGVEQGQLGQMVMPSRPGEKLSYTIERITPVAVASDGRNAFHVEAMMDSTPEWVRPGMHGVARTTIGKRALAWVYSHKLITFLRLKLWYFAGL
ncbi:MAG: HlyD family efflux transporter periplasmic adaptor subunit [Halioglobus sp.]